MIVAVDGPAASGKGTIAKGIADHYGLNHLDTGLLYRAVGLAVLGYIDAPDFEKTAINIAQNLGKDELDPAPLKAPEVALAAAKVARIDEVRIALRQFQRDFAARPPGAVLDGRDIGTRICPDADVKLFIIANPEVRAARRYKELLSKGLEANEADILRQIVERDESDRSNPAGNFYKSADAHLLDTSKLDIEAALHAVITIVDATMANRVKSQSP